MHLLSLLEFQKIRPISTRNQGIFHSPPPHIIVQNLPSIRSFSQLISSQCFCLSPKPCKGLNFQDGSRNKKAKPLKSDEVMWVMSWPKGPRIPPLSTMWGPWRDVLTRYQLSQLGLPSLRTCKSQLDDICKLRHGSLHRWRKKLLRRVYWGNKHLKLWRWLQNWGMGKPGNVFGVC